MSAQDDEPENAANDLAPHEPLMQAMIDALFAVAQVMGHPSTIAAPPPAELRRTSKGGRR